MLCGECGIQPSEGFLREGSGWQQTNRKDVGWKSRRGGKSICWRETRGFAHSRLVREGAHLVTSPGVTVQWWAGVIVSWCKCELV